MDKRKEISATTAVMMNLMGSMFNESVDKLTIALLILSLALYEFTNGGSDEVKTTLAGILILSGFPEIFGSVAAPTKGGKAISKIFGLNEDTKTNFEAWADIMAAHKEEDEQKKAEKKDIDESDDVLKEAFARLVKKIVDADNDED